MLLKVLAGLLTLSGLRPSYFPAQPLVCRSSHNSRGGKKREREEEAKPPDCCRPSRSRMERTGAGGRRVAGSLGRFCCFHFILINILRDRVTQAHAHMFTHTCVAGSAPTPHPPLKSITIYCALTWPRPFVYRGGGN